MKAQRRVNVQLYSFFSLDVRWEKLLTPRPGRFTLEKETRLPLYRRLGGPCDRSERVRKMSPTPGFDFRTVQPVQSWYTDWAIAVYVLTHNFAETLPTVEPFQTYDPSSQVVENVHTFMSGMDNFFNNLVASSKFLGQETDGKKVPYHLSLFWNDLQPSLSSGPFYSVCVCVRARALVCVCGGYLFFMHACESKLHASLCACVCVFIYLFIIYASVRI
jgi:hypothetical protein